MTKIYFYTAYGLNISSSLCFPELISGKPNSDVLIHYDGYESLLQKFCRTKKPGLNEILFNPNDVLYLLDNKPLFRVRSGKEIILNPNTNIDIVYLRHLILGPGLATLIRQKGNLVLHASAVNMDGCAVAFLGWGGDGKSTIATVMNTMGYQFVTDDVLKIKINKNNKPLAIPSFPRAKLWEDMIRFMENKTGSAQKIHSKIEKYALDVNQRFNINPLPLKRIYILEKSSKNLITPLKPQEALMELIKSSYAVDLLGSDGKTQNLIQCANLVSNVPVKRLKNHHSLKEIENLIQIVEKDIFNVN